MEMRKLLCGHCAVRPAGLSCVRCRTPLCAACVVDGLCLACYLEQRDAAGPASWVLLPLRLAAALLVAMAGYLAAVETNVVEISRARRSRRLARRNQARADPARASLRRAGWIVAGLSFGLALWVGAAAIFGAGRWVHASATRARLEVRTLESALDAYRLEHADRCPPSLERLVAERYLSRVPRDPWGERLRYSCPADRATAEVWSKGPDRQAGTGDDIRSSEI